MSTTAEDNNNKQGARPILLDMIHGCTETINAARLIPSEDGVISISNDKTLRVWLKRDSGQYWPSVCHFLPSEVSALHYNLETKRLFIGQDNGTIVEFELTADYNRLIHLRDYSAHQDRVTAIKFSVVLDLVLSCSKDKYFMWHCTVTGRRICGFRAPAACQCLEFDEETKHAFVGDSSGNIHILHLKENSFTIVTTLRGHSVRLLHFRRDMARFQTSGISALRMLVGPGSVRCLAWDPNKQLLFSGGLDQSVIMWDIGGGRGTAYELQGHRDSIQSLVHAEKTGHLVSGSDDSVLGIWDMKVKRVETPKWAESDVCQTCCVPFFWNVSKMWRDKKVGMRQHHCRHCGRALCHNCCRKLSTIPAMGYEHQVRVCDPCFQQITPDQQGPYATFYDMGHPIVHMDLHQPQKILLTTGRDHVMKIWDMRSVL